MKLLRYGEKGVEKPGLLDKMGIIRDLSNLIEDIGGDVLLPKQIDRLKTINPINLPKVENNPRIGACVTGIKNFLCIGLNYSNHAKESGMEIPSEPILFTKVTHAISGPCDDIIIPYNSLKTDWEAELGVVIGQPAKYVSTKNASDHVAGYCVVNDISERSYQLESTGQWVKGKSCDTFGPIGPWLVTPDEIEDPQNLDIWLEVNGRQYQESNTSNMIFGVAELISYLSHFFTLGTGDIISTGTPPGVGMGQKPDPVFLQGGEMISVGIENLGVQKQRTVREKIP